MGGPADEFEVHMRDRQRPVEDLRPRVGMEHHGRVDFLEDAGPDQADLPAAAFLGRGADDEHASRQPVERIGQRDPCPSGSGGNQVVAAAVAETAEGIVFGKERNRWAAPIAPAGHKRRWRAGDPELNAEPMFLEEFGQPGHRLVLFVADLRIGVNVPPDPFQLRPDGIDSGADFILQLADGRLSY